MIIVRNLPQSLIILLVLGILIGFVGCSASFELSKLRYHSSGAAVSMPNSDGEPAVLRPTTFYGFSLIIIIVLIGVGLWLWEIHEERIEVRPEQGRLHRSHKKQRLTRN